MSLRSGLGAVGDLAAPSAVGWLEEMLDGEELGDILGKEWSRHEALELVQGVTEALTYLHALEVPPWLTVLPGK